MYAKFENGPHTRTEKNVIIKGGKPILTCTERRYSKIALTREDKNAGHLR